MNAASLVPRPSLCYTSIDWWELFSATCHGEAVGVVVSACRSMESLDECIRTIFAAHHKAGWRATLWIATVLDHDPGDNASRARMMLGSFGEVLTVGGRSLRTCYQIGIGAITMHFARKDCAALLLTSSETVLSARPRVALMPRPAYEFPAVDMEC